MNFLEVEDEIELPVEVLVNAPKPELRQLIEDDFDDVKWIIEATYPAFGKGWTKKQFQTLLETFPDGQLCIHDDRAVVAVALSIIVDAKSIEDEHTYQAIIGNPYGYTYNSNGDVLFGLDILIRPDCKNLRLDLLFEARKELCARLNLRAVVMKGRIANYHHYVDTHTAKQYVDAVQKKELYDPVITLHLSHEFKVKRVIKSIFAEDQPSQKYSTLLEWTHLGFDPDKRKRLSLQNATVRISCVQWKMRAFSGIDELLRQVEHFIDGLSDYGCDLAVFPELFNATLMRLAVHDNQYDAIRFLATFTDAIRKAMSHLAMRYNVNILAGSMPVMEGKQLFNVSYLCRRDGGIDAQYKLHLTNHEQQALDMQPGHQLSVFETDVGRVGVLIAGDIEFPELGRLLNEKKMQILLVPFSTHTKNSYMRIRHCALARAIENECYVAIAGSISHLPTIDNMDIRYSQSAVFSPCRFNIPADGVIAETIPNTEMTLFAALDLKKLQTLQNPESDRYLLEHRHDLYCVQWIGE